MVHAAMQRDQAPVQPLFTSATNLRCWSMGNAAGASGSTSLSVISGIARAVADLRIKLVGTAD